ncbi:hypothetical protein HMPREF0307_00696 [Corynebacterium sp. DNF00584]|nr:hypothetical protein HMPREF0307_00696 [Corynebacterium sp. DNF00584]
MDTSLEADPTPQDSSAMSGDTYHLAPRDGRAEVENTANTHAISVA